MTGKKVNTRILKNHLRQQTCVNTHIWCFSLIYIEFPAQPLAGRFSVRCSHTRGVGWNTSSCVQLTSYFQYSAYFVFRCCGACWPFEPAHVKALVTLKVTKVKIEKNGPKCWRYSYYDSDFLWNNTWMYGICPGPQSNSTFQVDFGFNSHDSIQMNMHSPLMAMLLLCWTITSRLVQINRSLF